MAVVALQDLMLFGKCLPVFPLVRRQDSHPLAKGTGVFKCREDRRPDELGPVRYPLHGLGHGGIHFEGDHFLLGLSGAHVSFFLNGPEAFNRSETVKCILDDGKGKNFHRINTLSHWDRAGLRGHVRH